MHYVLLDEVQMVPEFEDVLNSFLHMKNVDTYVIGSNAKYGGLPKILEFHYQQGKKKNRSSCP